MVFMDTSPPWPAAWTHTVGREVNRLRKQRGLSAETLGRMCADLGFPIPRNLIMNLEHGRKDTMPVHELVVIAAALDVPPVTLLFPGNEWVSYLPDQRATCFEGIERFTGVSAEPAGWAETLGRILTDDEGEALLDVVNKIRARTRG